MGAPKVELHLHLDCSLSYEVVRRIAPAISRQAYEADFIAPPKCQDLTDYLARANRALALLQTRDSLHLATLDLFRQLRADGLIYAEIRFAPLLHLHRGLQPDEVVETVVNATREGITETGIEAGIILCTLRHFTAAQSMRTVRLVEQFREAGVVGFDIAADEAAFPIDNHIEAFTYAREKGIPCTAHAGEARGADSIWETLQHFQPQRIGHGVRSIEDEKLMDHLQERQIHLEVCPTSNVQTNVVDTPADHPVDQLYERGISISINTDGRALSHVTLSEEFRGLEKHFTWSRRHFFRSTMEAIAHAFCTENIRTELREKVVDFYQAESRVAIRSYQGKDQPDLEDLVMTIQNGEFRLGLRAEDQPDLMDIDTFYRDGGFWVAEIAGQVVGCIGLQQLNAQTGILRKMFLKKAYRGRPLSIGQGLYDLLEDAARDQGFRSILLDTPGIARAAHRFYERNGYREISKDHLPDGYTFIDVDSKVYQKNLAG